MGVLGNFTGAGSAGRLVPAGATAMARDRFFKDPILFGEPICGREAHVCRRVFIVSTHSV